jgi:putative acetyltransferase
MTSVQIADGIFIRTASNQDKESVCELLRSVLAEFGLRADTASTDADLDDIEKNYLARGGTFELLEDQAGTLLGTVGLYALDGETCELRKMYLVRQARGLGLGKSVLERAINHARRLGFKSIVLETASVLKDAVRLYTRFGFVPFESEHLAARCDQAYVLDLRQ